MVFWKLYVGFSVFNCFGFYYYPCLTRKMPEMAPEGPRADLGLRPLKVAKQNCIVATILESPAMLEMASGGPQGRSRPPGIESIRAKLYWSDHFGEPFKKRINNFAKCGYKAKNPKCILVLRFLFLVFGFFCLLGFHITRVLQGNRRKWPPEGPRADLGLRPLKLSKQNCIGATILESLPISTILESRLNKQFRKVRL